MTRFLDTALSNSDFRFVQGDLLNTKALKGVRICRSLGGQCRRAVWNRRSASRSHAAEKDRINRRALRDEIEVAGAVGLEQRKIRRKQRNSSVQTRANEQKQYRMSARCPDRRAEFLESRPHAARPPKSGTASRSTL